MVSMFVIICDKCLMFIMRAPLVCTVVSVVGIAYRWMAFAFFHAYLKKLNLYMVDILSHSESKIRYVMTRQNLSVGEHHI